MCDRGGGTKWRRGWKAVQNVSFNLFPLLIADSIFSFFYFCFNPLALRALPLYRCATPRNAAGHGRGRDCDLILLLLLSQFFNPSVLRTPPLYFAVHNTGEEDCNAVFFPILFCSALQCCGTRQGRGCDLILLLLLSLFFNPSVLRTPPLYFTLQNTGEEDWKATSSLYCFVAPRNAAGHGRGEVEIWFCCCCCFFNLSVLWTPPLYFAVHNTGEEDCNAVFFPILFCSAPQCCGTRQGRG